MNQDYSKTCFNYASKERFSLVIGENSYEELTCLYHQIKRGYMRDVAHVSRHQKEIPPACEYESRKIAS